MSWNVTVMARTRSGQGGSRSRSHVSRGRGNETRPPPIGGKGTSNPAPVTLEAIQKLLHDAQVQNRVEMNNLINERLQEFSNKSYESGACKNHK